MHEPQHPAGALAQRQIDLTGKQLALPRDGPFRRVAHGKGVIVAIGEEHLRHSQRRQQRAERLHDFLLAVHAIEVAVPRIAGSQLRP